MPLNHPFCIKWSERGPISSSLIGRGDVFDMSKSTIFSAAAGGTSVILSRARCGTTGSPGLWDPLNFGIRCSRSSWNSAMSISSSRRFGKDCNHPRNALEERIRSWVSLSVRIPERCCRVRGLAALPSINSHSVTLGKWLVMCWTRMDQVVRPAWIKWANSGGSLHKVRHCT